MSNAYRQALINSRLIDPESNRDDQGGLLIENGLIKDLGPHINQAYCQQQAIVAQDCAQQIIMPGLIDMRAQIQTTGTRLQDSVIETLDMAAMGGITSVCCLPTPNLALDHPSFLLNLQEIARTHAKSKLYAYGAITRNLSGQLLTDMGALQQAGALGFTDGIKAVDHPKTFNRALNYAQGFNSLILQFAEDQRLAEGAVATQTALAIEMGLPTIPALAEALQIERDLHFIAASEARYHSFPISTALAAAAIRRAKQKKITISCSTSPAYFLFNEFAIEGYHTVAKLSPPLRPESDRLAVIQALEDKMIDCICSDHVTYELEGKRTTFNQAVSGMIMLPFLLPLCLELHHEYGLGLTDILKFLTCNPAHVLGLPQGRLQAGRPADIILVDFKRTPTWETNDPRLRHSSSLFQNIKIQGKILQTYVDGRLVYDCF